VATAVASTNLQREGLKGAVRRADRLTTYALSLSLFFGAVSLAGQRWIIAAFTQEPSVITAVGPAYLPMTIMILLMWFKSIEGSLLGMGDGKFMSASFLPSAAVCLSGLALSVSHHWGIQGVWMSLLGYYIVLSTALVGRWAVKWGGWGFGEAKAATAAAAPAPAAAT
jgi:Na+-driven multidrug efflux pump